MEQEFVGRIEHYYPKAHAAVVRVERGALRVGDQVHIVGPRDDFWEEVTSLQVDRQPVEVARKGEEVGLYVEEPVHEGAEVLKIKSLVD